MLTDGAVAQFALVPNKDVLVFLKDCPKLLLPTLIQIGVNLDLLTDLLPSNLLLRVAAQCAPLIGLVIGFGSSRLGGLKYHWNHIVTIGLVLLQQHWPKYIACGFTHG